MQKYIPQLDGKTDPAVARAIRDLYSQVQGMAATQDAHAVALTAAPTNLAAAQNFMSRVASLPGFGFMVNGSSQFIFGSQGSIPPIISGSFIYSNAIAGQIAWSWTGLTMGPPHLAKVAVKTIIIPDGSLTINGLVAGTTYYFYPYYDQRRRILDWAAPSGTGPVGAPAIAYTTRNSVAAQYVIADGNIPLSAGPAMTAVATSGGGGGGGGGGRGTL